MSKNQPELVTYQVQASEIQFMFIFKIKLKKLVISAKIVYSTPIRKCYTYIFKQIIETQNCNNLNI